MGSGCVTNWIISGCFLDGRLFCDSSVLLTAPLGLIQWLAAHPACWHSNSDCLSTVVDTDNSASGIELHTLH